MALLLDYDEITNAKQSGIHHARGFPLIYDGALILRSPEHLLLSTKLKL